MAVTLQGSTSELILTRSGPLLVNNEGLATLSREYACATSYEFMADAELSIDSSVIDYMLTSEVSNLICNSVTKSRANGVTTYAVNYIGVTKQFDRTQYGTSILSYSKSVTTGTSPDNVTTQYTGTYAAPTVTRYYVSASGAYLPPTPSSGYDTRVLESYVDGVAGNAPNLTRTWLLTSLTSTEVGTYYIIQATGTKTITG
jgi:hypothetical protein